MEKITHSCTKTFGQYDVEHVVTRKYRINCKIYP